MAIDNEAQETIARLEKQLAKQTKVNQVLMDRVERSINDAGGAYSLFERNISLQQNTRKLEQLNANLHRMLDEASRLQEAAEQSNRAKGTFLANMSHELRTPLNAIIGYSELLQDEARALGNSRLLHDSQTIHSAGKQLLGLINDVLDLSKIEAGKMDLYLEDLDVTHMAEAVCATCRPLIRANANTLTLRYGDNIGTMHTDITKTRQILLNLLSNAAKFTKNGFIALEITREYRDSGDFLVFSVTDSGIGMTEEQIGRLFRAFSQADDSTTRRFGGTGLGLAITQHFCMMMGGSINVFSQPDTGSTFRVSLPAVVPGNNPLR